MWDEVHDIARMQVGLLQLYAQILENLIVEKFVVAWKGVDTCINKFVNMSKSNTPAGFFSATLSTGH